MSTPEESDIFWQLLRNELGLVPVTGKQNIDAMLTGISAKYFLDEATDIPKRVYGNFYFPPPRKPRTIEDLKRIYFEKFGDSA
jgi:hypothetical protein